MLTSNARIICASNCSLRERVRQGKFREDLYQRLNGLTLLIPPLRERLQELPALIAAELKAAGLKEGQKHYGNSSRSDEKLLHHRWRGNLRELSHTNWFLRWPAITTNAPLVSISRSQVL
jgi:DNA-binding NtrC family response regulator